MVTTRPYVSSAVVALMSNVHAQCGCPSEISPGLVPCSGCKRHLVLIVIVKVDKGNKKQGTNGKIKIIKMEGKGDRRG